MNKRHHLVLAVAAASLVLTGCGSKEDAKKPSGDKTTVAASSGTDLTKANFISTVTAAQQKAKTSHVTMDMSAASQKINATGDVEVGATVADTKVSMKMDLGSLGGGSMEMRLVDKTFYINMGAISNNKFAKLDLTDKSNPLTAQYGGLLDQLDPSKQLEQLKGAVRSVEKKGAAITLDGVKAQPYEMTVDTTKLKDLKGAGAQVPDTITYTMFIGPDNLPRRFTFDLMGSKATMDYSKWGESVDIKQPAKDQITDSSFLDQLGKAPA